MTQRKAVKRRRIFRIGERVFYGGRTGMERIRGLPEGLVKNAISREQERKKGKVRYDKSCTSVYSG